MRTPRTLAAALALAVVAGCGPAQSGPAGEGGDETTGTLRVWLFDEANRTPKEAVVNEAIAAFEAEHEGVDVDVQWVAVEGRADKFAGAFNDPSNAPDVAEFGNTDVASYVETGALADLTAELRSWEHGDDLLPSVLDTARVDGEVYGLPWFTGIRALYYRTDVFAELGLTPPATLDELAETARTIRAARPDLYGISVGGKYVYAMLPFLWAAGGELARQEGGRWTAAVTSEAAQRGVTAYTRLIQPDICPPEQCADLTGTQSVQAFAGGKAAMTIGGDFNRKAVEAGEAGGKYAVVPLPGFEPGAIAPAFAGGNLLGVFGASQRRGLAVEFVQLLGGPEYQRRMYEAMGNLPTLGSVQRGLVDQDPFLEPFVATLRSGTRFVPGTPAWSRIDAQGVLPTAVQRIATGEQRPEEALGVAAEQMNSAFGG
ncbi:N,N'-diacetylchitobiose transport system substrate-binding protein [Amycolatopsis arida]|uniref:N,N'-diacetylchitobiose transport system substrate-binding protein n=1 Tax=Amycolatopsis arida TaxID=587909 RepID=A0A1I6AGN4_9PSEU|nr:extracellular solute-binding protein [Amycolatopsis arida]TDX97726.1 N,N'-diacetylchitobiose transport system substrate-binding protein [Amycolatopsis arida]SFQ67825.1 N,N'-diacetylchitobiose transport system substrate-binding protein [Amycolatopsis arida]